MYKEGDILKLNTLGLITCGGGPKLRIAFIKNQEVFEYFTGQIIQVENESREPLKFFKPSTYIHKYYELAERTKPLNEIEYLDAIQQNMRE